LYIKEGDAILLSGSIANHGMAVMSKRKGIEFESAILSDTRPLNHICLQLIEAFGKDIHYFRDPTRGGVATVLHEIATQANVGVEIHSDRLPVEEQVAGLCEILGMDPLYVANEGLFIAVVEKEVAGGVLSEIRNHPWGTQAEIIGHITAVHSGKIILHNGFGGKRWLLPLRGEQLPRIC
jgi:hydrogenase expression/formation protein HypE